MRQHLKERVDATDPNKNPATYRALTKALVDLHAFYPGSDGIKRNAASVDTDANMANRESNSHNETHIQISPLEHSIPRGAVDVTTGQYYPGAAGGIINPRSGEFYPDVGGGYINPSTGQFMPKQ